MKTNVNYRWDWPLAGLTIILVYVAAARLSLTNWTPDLGNVEVTAILGTILGLALGVSQFKKKAVLWLVAGYSIFTIPWILMNIVASEKTAIGRLSSLGGRLFESFSALTRAEKIDDSIFFVALMCVLFWFVGIFSAYRLTRQSQVLNAIIPSTIPILVVQYYDGYFAKRLWVAGLYFFIAILILGRRNILIKRDLWKEKRVFAGAEPEFDLTRGLVITAALLIFASWSAPTPAAAVPTIARIWGEFSQPFDNVRGRIDDALSALKAGTRVLPGELYGKQMGLGQIAGQGDAQLFTVKPVAYYPTYYYWRVRIYDSYKDGLWALSGSENVPFDPDILDPDINEPIDMVLTTEKSNEFVFAWKTSRTVLLVTPVYPFWVSRTGFFQTDPLKKDTRNLSSWNASVPVERGDQYRVQAVVFSPTIKDLRNAGTDYPYWITSRYLDLPENLSENIRRLASQLTNDQPTTYDKVMAVTNYLRSEMEYSLTIPTPPPGIDPVDWFLFAWKKGFCNYYATSEVLLLRSAGIPARMVVGYAQGASQPDGTYSVSGKDAHAWPEIYFPQIGWVEFEPTVSQDPIFRPSGEEPVANEDDATSSLRERPNFALDGLEPTEPGNQDAVGNQGNIQFLSLQVVMQWVIILMITAGVGYLAWRLEKQRSFAQRIPHIIKLFLVRYNITVPAWVDRWVRWSEVTPIERAFHAVNQSLGWLGIRPTRDITAAERSVMLKALLPEAAQEIEILVIAHEKALYTPVSAEPLPALRAAWRIRYQTLRAILRRWLNGE